MMKKESELQVENDVRRWNAAVSVVVFCFVLGPGGGGRRVGRWACVMKVMGRTES